MLIAIGVSCHGRPDMLALSLSKCLICAIPFLGLRVSNSYR